MTEPLHEVRLQRLPLHLLAKAKQHGDALTREFALIAHPHPDSDGDVPARLVELVQRLQGEYGGFTGGPQQLIDEAVARGEDTIDVTFRVPASLRHAAQELNALLREADEFCRSGDLLTLAPSGDVVALREWYLDEFIRQIEGQAPRPWGSGWGSGG